MVGHPLKTTKLSQLRRYSCRFIPHKTNVYKEKPPTLEESKAAIRNQTALTNEQLLGKVEKHFRERLDVCVHENGRNFGEAIFKNK